MTDEIDPAKQAEAAAYLFEILRGLSSVAEQGNLPMVQFFLQMAVLEAADYVDFSEVGPGRPKGTGHAYLPSEVPTKPKAKAGRKSAGNAIDGAGEGKPSHAKPHAGKQPDKAPDKAPGKQPGNQSGNQSDG